MTNWDGTPEVEHRNSRTSEITRAREKNLVLDTSFLVELRGFARSGVQTFRCRTQLIENLTYHFAGCWDASGVGGVGGRRDGIPGPSVLLTETFTICRDSLIDQGPRPSHAETHLHQVCVGVRVCVGNNINLWGNCTEVSTRLAGWTSFAKFSPGCLEI